MDEPWVVEQVLRAMLFDAISENIALRVENLTLTESLRIQSARVVELEAEQDQFEDDRAEQQERLLDLMSPEEPAPVADT